MTSTLLRRLATTTIAALPLYRLLPRGRARLHAGVLYHARHSSAAGLCAYVEAGGRAPTERYGAALLVARSAFAAGRDGLALEVLDGAARRFPDQGELHELWAELLCFHGDYEQARRHALDAWLLAPDSRTAAAKAVRMHHFAGAPDADAVAREALERYPRNPAVLWAAFGHCRSPEQLAALTAIWTAAVEDPEHVQAGIRPVGNAAARSGRLDLALEIYGVGLALQLRGVAPRRAVVKQRLEGHGALGALDDIGDALGRAGIPFFFAAGTALGLVREGRPLGHDADIDVGILEGDWDHAAIAGAFEKHPMFVFEQIHPTSTKVALRHRGGSPVDVFRFYRDGDKVWHDGTFVRWWNTPFEVETREIGGPAVPVPAGTERYLTESYGDWRTPDPSFDAFVDGPNVEVTWPEYRDLYLLRRAYRRWSAGDRIGAAADIEATSDTLGGIAAGRDVLRLLAG